MLSYRLFKEHLGDEVSKHKLSNDLAQGSVLPPAASRKFGYVDDWTLATQHNLMEITQELLNSDLIIISQYPKNS